MNESAAGVSSLDELQHWTWVMGRAQQMMMEFWAAQSARQSHDASLSTDVFEAWEKLVASNQPVAQIAETQQR